MVPLMALTALPVSSKIFIIFRNTLSLELPTLYFK